MRCCETLELAQLQNGLILNVLADALPGALTEAGLPCGRPVRPVGHGDELSSAILIPLLPLIGPLGMRRGKQVLKTLLENEGLMCKIYVQRFTETGLVYSPPQLLQPPGACVS
ncbi:uncharacterized protein RHO17_025430 [Thomomys bottae]